MVEWVGRQTDRVATNDDRRVRGKTERGGGEGEQKCQRNRDDNEEASAVEYGCSDESTIQWYIVNRLD